MSLCFPNSFDLRASAFHRPSAPLFNLNDSLALPPHRDEDPTSSNLRLRHADLQTAGGLREAASDARDQRV